jgi:hypothetical protein
MSPSTSSPSCDHATASRDHRARRRTRGRQPRHAAPGRSRPRPTLAPPPTYPSAATTGPSCAAQALSPRMKTSQPKLERKAGGVRECAVGPRAGGLPPHAASPSGAAGDATNPRSEGPGLCGRKRGVLFFCARAFRMAFGQAARGVATTPADATAGHGSGPADHAWLRRAAHAKRNVGSRSGGARVRKCSWVFVAGATRDGRSSSGVTGGPKNSDPVRAVDKSCVRQRAIASGSASGASDRSSQRLVGPLGEPADDHPTGHGHRQQTDRQHRYGPALAGQHRRQRCAARHRHQLPQSGGPPDFPVTRSCTAPGERAGQVRGGSVQT